MGRTWNWIKHEFREILPVWVFFLVSFGLMAFTLSTVLGDYHIESSQPPEYIGGSLIMAKAVVVIDACLKRRWLRNRALIYAVVFNTILYFAGGFTIRHVEQVSKLMWRQHLSLAQANQHVLRAMEQPRYWAIMIWVVMVILGFSVIREVIRLLGSDRFYQTFFRKHPSSTGEDVSKAA